MQTLRVILPLKAWPVCWCRTRAEFQAWAQGLAKQYGYSVSFNGVGHTCREGAALQGLGLHRGVLGAATQVAVFERAAAQTAAGQAGKPFLSGKQSSRSPGCILAASKK